jgi:hypothetical protein
VSEYQITFWREIPSLIVARSGEVVAKVSLPALFQEAIDEAAMRLGAVDSDAYLAGWTKGAWLAADGTPDEVAHSVADSLINEFSELRITEILDMLSKGAEQ